MAMLAWVMMGLAIWHFTIFVDDRFAGGIVGAFVAALVGAALFGYVVSGLSVPGRDDTDLLTALLAVPGALLGLGVSYLVGARSQRAPGASSSA
ncbi:MAG: hypothetical protein H0U79_03565 [Solirubrobacterales bacterium]|nr:hypothetical protein [Solirubrobacterales bacterium]